MLETSFLMQMGQKHYKSDNKSLGSNGKKENHCL